MAILWSRDCEKLLRGLDAPVTADTLTVQLLDAAQMVAATTREERMVLIDLAIAVEKGCAPRRACLAGASLVNGIVARLREAA